MDVFTNYLAKLEPEQRERMTEVLQWIRDKHPELEPEIKWNQPVFTAHGTYIIGFSAAKKHMSVAPEQAGITQFLKDIVAGGYEHTKELVRFRWDQPFDYELLAGMIAFNLMDKADCPTFWRKS